MVNRVSALATNYKISSKNLPKLLLQTENNNFNYLNIPSFAIEQKNKFMDMYFDFCETKRKFSKSINFSILPG